MHLFLATRGVKHFSELWETVMQGKFFPWKRKNLKTKKQEIFRVQGALRPVRFYEYVFPEESLDEVLTMLNIDDKKIGMPDSKKHRAFISFFRKILGAKKIPKYTPVDSNQVIDIPGMAVIPIGIKKDRREKNKDFGYEQEML